MSIVKWHQMELKNEQSESLDPHRSNDETLNEELGSRRRFKEIIRCFGRGFLHTETMQLYMENRDGSHHGSMCNCVRATFPFGPPNLKCHPLWKHCKNCECCPVSHLIVRYNKDCHESRFLIVNSVTNVSNVTSPYDHSFRMFSNGGR